MARVIENVVFDMFVGCFDNGIEIHILSWVTNVGAVLSAPLHALPLTENDGDVMCDCALGMQSLLDLTAMDQFEKLSDSFIIANISSN